MSRDLLAISKAYQASDGVAGQSPCCRRFMVHAMSFAQSSDTSEAANSSAIEIQFDHEPTILLPSFDS